MAVERQTGRDGNRRVTDPRGLLDFCPRCRIQAPHKPGRDGCPRCHGPLDVVSATPAAPMRQAAPAIPPPPAQRRAPRVFHNPHLRWTARRPPEARPTPRNEYAPTGPGRTPTPRYLSPPRWGLGNLPPLTESPTVIERKSVDHNLTRWFTSTAIVLGVTAIAHLARYLLLSVNRTVVIPGWSDWLTIAAVNLTGVLAIFVMVATAIAVARWIQVVRADSYRAIGRTDPRRGLVILLVTLIPLVNLVGPAWLLYEVIRLDDEPTRQLRARRLRVMWTAWGIVNVLAALAIAYRFLAESIQQQADGLFITIVSAGVSAVFAWWIRFRLRRLFDSEQAPELPSTRWVITQ